MDKTYHVAPTFMRTMDWIAEHWLLTLGMFLTALAVMWWAVGVDMDREEARFIKRNARLEAACLTRGGTVTEDAYGAMKTCSGIKSEAP